jgi:hypothetical protein
VLVELALGLAATTAVSDADAGAEAEVCDEDADADADVDACDDVAVPELGAAGDVEVELVLVLLLGLLLGLVLDGVGFGELEEGDGVGFGELEVGDGVGFGELEEGDGVGVGVLVAGSTWHLVAVLGPAEVPGLGEAVMSRSAPARATPGRPTSTPRVRNPPASTLSITARTCASRMKNALVSATHQGCCLLFVGSEAIR